MRFSGLLPLMFLAATMLMRAGDKPTLHLTGNPRADFFGSRMGVSSAPLASADSVSATEIELPEHGRKSPWLAGALSLVVPGAGEVYTENYVKGAIFFTIEAASLITAHIYDKKGDHQTDVFQDYANAHWSPIRYAEWMRDNLTEIAQENGKATPDWDPRILKGANPNCGPPFPCVDWKYLNLEEQDSLGMTHALPYWGDQQYYELIGKYAEFSKGWDSQVGSTSDYRDAFTANPQFNMYRDMFNQADRYYNVAGAAISVAIANHILSALDAAWSAARFNSSLHADVQMRMVPTRAGVSAVTQANLSLSF